MLEFSLMCGGFYGWSCCDYRGMWCILDFAAMRTIKSLLWFLAAFALTVYVGLANAAAPVTTWMGNWPGGTVAWKSLDEACDSFVAYKNTTQTSPGRCLPPQVPVSNTIRWWNPYAGGNTSFVLAPTTKCADGSPPKTGLALNLQCPDLPPPDLCEESTQTKSVTYKMFKGKTPIYNPWLDTPGAKNSGNCLVEIIEVEDCYTLPKSSDPSAGYCTFKTRQKGGLANSGVPTPDAGTESEADKERDSMPPAEGKNDGSCPKGTVNAGLSASGIPMCIGNGTKPVNGPPAAPKIESEKNETLPDGSVKNTKTVTTTNTDLSKTTVTTVTITRPSGEKETNQEKKTTDTPAGKPGAETPPQTDFCKQNPNLAVCRNSTVAGKCGETTCSGDAIQCATLRAAAAMECKQRTDEETLKAMPETTLGQKILAGADPMGGQIDTVMKGTEIDLSKPALDQTAFIGGGSCLPNKTMSVMGRPITVEFTQLCTNIQPLRGVIMACAFILAYMIVSRSVLQG